MKIKHVGGVAIVTAMLALVAACGSSKTGAASQPKSPAAPTSGVGAPAGSAGAVATVKTAAGSVGTHLTDGEGRTLYLWVADKSGPSTCYDACAQAWPPLLTSGAPTAASGVDASKLGTSKRTDGTTQATYYGHPLYRFSQDASAGDTKGQGSNGFGAKWWMVGTNGQPLTGGAGASPSSGGGYNY